MSTLVGTICTCSMTPVFSSSGRFHTSSRGVPSLIPLVTRAPQQRSSLWGSSSSSSRLSIPTAESDSSPTVKSSPLIIAGALLEEQEVAKKGTSGTTTREAASPSVAAEETSTSYASRGNGADNTVWKATRAARKTTRRRALAFTLALAGLSQRGSSSDAQGRDLIRVSQSTAANVPGPTFSPATGDQYGDLVTVSTGSDPSNDGEGMVSYSGEDFRIRVPDGWIESNTEIATGSVLRYEDKADPSTNVIVLRSPTSQSRTGNLGSPEDWIREQAYLLSGSNEPLQFQSADEGTEASKKFPSGRVSIAKVLNDKPKYKQGLTYYNYEILTKQGGEQTDVLHELVSAVVNDGNLYLCRVQTGEGRWQEDSQSMAQRIVDSFQITGFKIHA